MFSYEINVLCDQQGCRGSIVTSEPLAWPDLREALITAQDEGWQIDLKTLRAYCPLCKHIPIKTPRFD